MARYRPETLLFDLGGVLVDNAMFDELPALLPAPIEDDELRHRWLFSPSVQAFERGEISPDDFASAFTSEWRLQISPTEFLEIFASWPRGPYPGATELLDRLRGDYRLTLLSNSNVIHWGGFKPLRDRVEAAFSSHLLGLVKPDPAIFQLVLDALGVEPGSVCFFDDSQANVDAALSVGMEAHLARGVPDLERVVRQLAC